VLGISVVIPLKAGESWVNETHWLLLMAWFPLFLVLTVVADSFAGERERRTLETLLATRLSDQAILAGKIISAVIYAWGQMVLCLITGLITVNVMYGRGRLLMFAGGDLAAFLVFSLLLTILVVCAGVLASLRASTAREAMRNLIIGFMDSVLGGTFLVSPKIWPVPWREAVIKALFGGPLLQTEILIAMLLIAVNVMLYSAARVRFRRARLILD
jgi:ABC-2 type transport system permease protein